MSLVALLLFDPSVDALIVRIVFPLKDLGVKFPEVRDSIAALDVQDLIIDGEIVALDEKGRSSFQLLQSFDMG